MTFHLDSFLGARPVMVGVMLLLPSLMDRIVLREHKYWQHPGGIQITSHHSSYDEEGRPCVIGTIKNVSTRPWRWVTIEAEYFDRAGKLVDTGGEDSLDTLAPGGERSFKLVFGKKQKGAEYDHYRVHIAGAEDASVF